MVAKGHRFIAPQERRKCSACGANLKGYAASGSGQSVQRLEVDVAELDAQVVALEADVPLLAQDAGVALGVLLDVIVEVGVHEDGAILLDGDLPALGDDLDTIPFADLLVLDRL